MSIRLDWQIGVKMGSPRFGNSRARVVDMLKLAWEEGSGFRGPLCGYFRLQTEYAVWATKGRVPRKEPGGHAGVMHTPTRRDKKHVA